MILNDGLIDEKSNHLLCGAILESGLTAYKGFIYLVDQVGTPYYLYRYRQDQYLSDDVECLNAR